MGSLRLAQLCVDQLHLCGRGRATLYPYLRLWVDTASPVDAVSGGCGVRCTMDARLRSVLRHDVTVVL